MRTKLLISLVSLAVSVNSFSMSPSHAEKIYKRISQSNGINAPKLLVVKCKVRDAENVGKAILIFTGMLYGVKNDDEMAMVLAHELAHTTLHHLSTGGNSKEKEYAADRQGAIYARNAGYNICRGALPLKQMKENNTHPAGILRFKALGC